MSGTAAPVIILLDGATAVAAGPSIGLQGEAMALGGQTRQLFNYPIHVNARMIGGTSATVVIEKSVDGITWTPWGTFVFTSTGIRPEQSGMVNVKYIRANVTAIAGGGAINCYARIGQG
jgi:hypothetical protein